MLCIMRIYVNSDVKSLSQFQDSLRNRISREDEAHSQGMDLVGEVRSKELLKLCTKRNRNLQTKSTYLSSPVQLIRALVF